MELRLTAIDCYRWDLHLDDELFSFLRFAKANGRVKFAQYDMIRIQADGGRSVLTLGFLYLPALTG